MTTATLIKGNTLYKLDSKGKLRSWHFEVEGNKYRTVAGLVGGSLVTSAWTTCTAASQPTDEAQAQFEAAASYQHNLDREYHATREAAESGVKKMFEPMLAKDFAKVVTDKKPLTYPVIVQPKLDGIRCVITAKGAFSRQNQQFHSIPHIIEATKSFFDRNPDAVLDGELYNHALKADFQEITSIVRREKLSPEDVEKSARLIQYHVYDVCAPGNWAVRTTAFREWFRDTRTSDAIVIVKTRTVMDRNGLDLFHGSAVEEGYEGSMLRLPGDYENKRSFTLLKRKDFEDGEFEVIGIESGRGNWDGAAKRFILKVPGARVEGMPEDQCDAGTRGTFDDNAKVLIDKDKYIGSPATVRYFGKTNDGALRFPVVIDLHPGGRKD